MTSALAASAQEYRELGLSVFPVGRDKHPLIEWKPYQDELPHPDEIDVWWDRWPEANIGLATGKVSGLVVLDADGPPGLASLKSLGTPATTWLSRTGRTEGGWQQFFQHPGGAIHIGNRAGLKPGLDVRGDGGYVIVPPSVHASGRRYEWRTSPKDVPLAPLPEPVLKLLLPPASPNGPLSSGDGAIPQGQRNDHLYRQARALLAKGLGQAALVAALLEENRTRCQPPLSEFEVRTIARHAATQPHRSDFGGSREERDSPRILVSAVEAHALLARTYQEPPAIVGGGILPRQALGFLAGPPKKGKSAKAMNLGLLRSVGRPWLGVATTPGRTVIIQAEIPERELQGRLRMMLEDFGSPLPRDLLHFVTDRTIRLDRPDGLRWCRSLVEELHPDLLIIDPLARFFSGEENSAREVGRLIGSLDELIQAYGVALLLIHHAAKPTATDPREGGLRLRGSSALFGAADSVLMLDRAEGDLFRLTFELRHGKEPEPMLLTRSERLWFAPAGPPEEVLAVAATVRTLPLPWGQLVAALKTEQGVSKATAERLIKRALMTRVITKNSDGHYIACLTPPQSFREGEVSAHA